MNSSPEPTSKGEAASEQTPKTSISGILNDLLWKDITFEQAEKALRQRDTQLIAKLRELGPKKDTRKNPAKGADEGIQIGWNGAIAQFETLFQQIERGEL